MLLILLNYFLFNNSIILKPNYKSTFNLNYYSSLKSRKCFQFLKIIYLFKKIIIQ